MTSELVEQNYTSAKSAEEFFKSLLAEVDRAVEEVIESQNQLKKTAGFSTPRALVSFEEREHVTDAHSRDQVVYRSTVGTVRLFHNEPIGWIYGEIEQRTPWTGLRKCFALKPAGSANASEIIGCYTFGGEPTTAGLLAKKIITDLAQGSITKELLDARSSLVEANRH
jgi:hypothetical protein